MQLTVIIVNYNVKYFLEQCLDSLSKALMNLDAEIFVVDNASSDESIEYLQCRFPKFNYIRNENNEGFAKANNQAIRLSSGKYVLLLNPDTIVGENVIDDCLNFMDKDSTIGGVGVKMLNADGSFAFESRRGLPSPMTSFYKIIGLCACFPYSRRFGKYYLRFLDENETNRIDVISGAFMFIRREAIEKSGYLDESFFMYGEDVDLSYRITQAGYKNYYLPSSIIHYKGESTKKDSYRYVRIFYDAMIIFFKKHYPHYGFLFFLLVTSAIYARASFAISVRLFKRIKKSLRINTERKTFRFCVLGNEKTIRDVREICKKNHLKGRHHYMLANELSTPNGHLTKGISLDEFTHVVYDSDEYSYSYMMKLFCSFPMKGVELGTYSPRSGVLIIPENIYL